jgi:HK97 family phage prohead protease
MLKKDAGQGQIKDVDTETGTVTGYFAIFGKKDSDGDIIQRGAFAKTIAEKGKQGSNRIKHLFQHSPDKVLSKPDLQEDEKGLYFESKITKTTLGMDVLKLYEEGALDEHSIGFIPVKVVPSQEQEADILTEIDLWEGSTVTWGAQEMARVDGKAQEYAAQKVDKLRKALKHGSYSDQTFKQLEAWLNKLLEARTLPGEEPPTGTPEPETEPQREELKAISTALDF